MSEKQNDVDFFIEKPCFMSLTLQIGITHRYAKLRVHREISPCCPRAGRWETFELYTENLSMDQIASHSYTINRVS